MTYSSTEEKDEKVIVDEAGLAKAREEYAARLKAARKTRKAEAVNETEEKTTVTPTR